VKIISEMTEWMKEKAVAQQEAGMSGQADYAGETSPEKKKLP